MNWINKTNILVMKVVRFWTMMLQTPLKSYVDPPIFRLDSKSNKISSSLLGPISQYLEQHARLVVSLACRIPDLEAFVREYP